MDAFGPSEQNGRGRVRVGEGDQLLYQSVADSVVDHVVMGIEDRSCGVTYDAALTLTPTAQ